MCPNLTAKVTIIGLSVIVLQDGTQKMVQAYKEGREADLAALVNELEATFAKVIEHLNDADKNASATEAVKSEAVS